MLKSKIMPIACVLLACCVIAAVFTGCSGKKEDPTYPYTYKYRSTEADVSAAEPTTESYTGALAPLTDAGESASDESQTDPETYATNEDGSYIATSIAVVTMTPGAVTAAPPAPTAQANTATAPMPVTSVASTTEPIVTAAPTTRGMTDARLSITLPDANGTMVVTDSASNSYIKTVAAQRNIPASKLVACYAVPDSGQNYVLEFGDSTDMNHELVRDETNLRRVYLLNEYGEITYVAASDEAECENVTAVENWFCMDVIIKKMIMPEIIAQLS